MLETLHQYPAVAEAVVQVFASRLRHLVALVEDLSFRQVTARVARIVLQSVAPHEGVGAGVGRARVSRSARSQRWPARAARSSPARSRRSRTRAAIDLHRGEIRVADEARLNTLA